jgi:plasmid stabilization system protein ParE
VRKKTHQLIWDNEALLSFKEAIEYIKSESTQGAEIVKSTVLNSLKLIKSNPKVFPKDLLKESNDGTYRAYSIYSYRITYKITGTLIKILRFRHTSREPFDY